MGYSEGVLNEEGAMRERCGVEEGWRWSWGSYGDGSSYQGAEAQGPWRCTCDA
jgi:hypothetical protein